MAQPTQLRATRRTVLAVAAGLLVAVVAVVVTVLVRSAGGGALTSYPADRAAREPVADPTRNVDTHNYRDSVRFATDFVDALVRRDATTAYDGLCGSARQAYPDAAALQARFDEAAGGRVAGARYDTVYGDGPLRDGVVFSVALADGGRGSLTVVVDDDGGHLGACELQGGSAAPTY